MDKIEIIGGTPLEGRIPIAGAKNACLALMPAAILSDKPLTLMNAPRLSDIQTMGNLLESLGVEVKSLQSGQVITLSAHGPLKHLADYDIVRKMRASILVLGPLLARQGQAVVSQPGGCAIGARPIDLHLYALERLGADWELKGGYVHVTAKDGLKGGVIEFPAVSVGATENAVMAATLANGTTEIRNAAKEPEISDLAVCLGRMGAVIEGAGTDVIRIRGVTELGGATHPVIPDRIEMGTYMLAAAMTGGNVELAGAKRELVEAFAAKLEEAGAVIEDDGKSLKVRVNPDGLSAVNVVTEPYPGFPTDLQAQMMAALAIADGTSILDEQIFENRFMHVPELTRMGADINTRSGTATVKGVRKLKGAQVMATDLRASVSLVLAGLAAEGTTTVSRVYHLDRGYEQIEKKLSSCGAKIRRIGS